MYLLYSQAIVAYIKLFVNSDMTTNSDTSYNLVKEGMKIAKKELTPEQITNKLGKAEILLNQGTIKYPPFGETRAKDVPKDKKFAWQNLTPLQTQWTTSVLNPRCKAMGRYGAYTNIG